MLYLGDHHTFQSVSDDSATYGQGVEEATIDDEYETFTITNNGKQRVTNGIVELDGTITNPTILNTRNKYQFAWTGSLGSTDRFTINIATLATKKNGLSGEWANVTLGTARGQLMPMALEPGDNDFEVRSTSPNCTFRFYFAKPWL